MTAAEWATIHHFTPSEFAEPEAMRLDFMLKLDRTRERAGVPFVITSSARTPEHNAEVHGAKRSAHMERPCGAADILPRNSYDCYKILQAAFAEDWPRVGVYENGSLHLDISTDLPQGVVWTKVDA